VTLPQLFAILRARWMVALGAFVLVFGTVAAITWLMPKTYTATASVILDVKNADPIAGMVSPTIATPAYLMTQVDVITSNRVAVKVVKALRLNESSDMRAKWQESTKGTGSFEGWLATLLRSNLDAKPSRGSNVIYLSYQAADPNFAAAITNAFVQAYLDTSLELRTSPARQSKDFFDANVKSSRAALETAQARLSAYQQQQGILVTSERLDIETARLNELSSQLVMMQSAVADSSSRQQAANTQGDRSPDVVASSLVSTLKADLIRQQGSLEQLSTRYGDQHPLVREARSGLEETNRKLEAEVRRITSSVGVGNDVNLSRVAQTRFALDAQRAKVMKMKAVRDEAAILERDVDSAQRAYDIVLARMSNTNLESQANQANVSALELATPPALPSSPRLLFNIALGGLLAAGVAVALSLLIERVDRRLRTADEVEALMAVPVIGAIPSFNKRKFKADVPRRIQLPGLVTPALTHKA
jgi:succinoglycan biosynthesis transport protein ExoP